MKTLSLLLVVFCSLTQAQNSVSLVQYLDSPGTNSITVQAPATLSGNVTLTLPVPTGTTGCVQDSTGAGVLTISACGVPTVPVTISGSSTSPILTLTQTGAGPTLVTGGGNVGIGMSSPAFLLDVNGAENLHGNLSVSADNTFNIFAASLAPSAIYTHALSASGNAVFTGLVAEGLSGCPPCSWDISGGGVGGFTSGAAYFQDVTSRYVFNSAGDVAQTGTVNVSGTAATATSGTFDQSFVGGQLLICPGGCTGTNGSLYLISALISSTQVTLATSPGTLTGAGYSYQANAFQTSLGTMYITGSGFGYFQNLVVTDGLVAYGGGSASSIVSTSGVDVTWSSGDKFNQSMQGGVIAISAVDYIVSSVPTDHNLVLTTSAGVQTGVLMGYTSLAFQLGNHTAFIDDGGFGTFAGLTSGGVSTTTLTATALSALTQVSIGTGGLYISGNTLLLGAVSLSLGSAGTFAGTHGQNVGSGDSPTFNVLTVSSCTGCGSGGVSSFNTRTGAVTLSSGDVTAAVQALLPASSPTFSGLTDTGSLIVQGATDFTGSVNVFANAIDANGGVAFGSSSNSYLRTFSGAPSCSGVANGWFGFDTSTTFTPTLTAGTLWICNGGVATAH